MDPTQMNANVSMAEAAALLRAADNILLLTHRSPDGDTVGSASALCMALRALGRTAHIVTDSRIGGKLLPFAAPHLAPADFVPGFVCSVDCASPSQICAGGQRYAEAVDLAIDHHPSNTRYARASLVVSEAAANCEILVSLIKELGVALDRDIALPLYLGIATDTGCFRYADSTPNTFRCAAELIGTGIDFYALNRRFFEEKSRGRLALEKILSEHTEYHGDAVFSYYTLAEVAETGADEDDRNNLASVLMSIENIKMGLLLRESTDGGWKLSARSVPGVDVCALCARFGGGGHLTASGASFPGGFDEAHAAILAAAAEQLTHDGYTWA